MSEVFNLKEAMYWFLHNHSGSVMCVKDGVRKSCDSYPEAEAFFESEASNE